VVKAIIFASACRRNFIRQHNADDLATDFNDDENSEDSDEVDDEQWAGAIEVFPFDFFSASNRRDWMTTAMWEEYEGFQCQCPVSFAITLCQLAPQC
jgi:hypothetical protein